MDALNINTKVITAALRQNWVMKYVILMTRIYRLHAGHFRRRSNYRVLRNVRLNPAAITKAGWSDNCVNLPCNVGATYHDGRRAILPPRYAPKNHSSLFPLFRCSCRGYYIARISSSGCGQWAAIALVSLNIALRDKYKKSSFSFYFLSQNFTLSPLAWKQSFSFIFEFQKKFTLKVNIVFSDK